MTDHILGLESKISSLFFLYRPTGDHKKDFACLIWPNFIKLLMKENILAKCMVLLRILKLKGFALIVVKAWHP